MNPARQTNIKYRLVRYTGRRKVLACDVSSQTWISVYEGSFSCDSYRMYLTIWCSVQMWRQTQLSSIYNLTVEWEYKQWQYESCTYFLLFHLGAHWSDWQLFVFVCFQMRFPGLPFDRRKELTFLERWQCSSETTVYYDAFLVLKQWDLWLCSSAISNHSKFDIECNSREKVTTIWLLTWLLLPSPLAGTAVKTYVLSNWYYSG